MKRLVAAMFAASATTWHASAQQQDETRVVATVTAVNGPVVYLDKGGDAGIEPGDRARATPPGGVTVELIVRAVSRQSARCEIVGAGEVLVGAEAEVLIPAVRASRTSEHAWSYQEKGWSPDMPLLAPVQGVKPSERARRFSGRVFQTVDWIRDDADIEQEYLLSRTGVDARVENAFGAGDELVFDAELFHRAVTVGDVDEEDTTRARIDRFSWRIGDSRETASRLEVGRFLSSELPQLGVIDGVEYVRRTESGSRWGASFGMLPAWDDRLSTGDDVQAALFHRWFAGDEQQLTAAAGFQKTWHEGEADRDLFVADFNWRASEAWRFAGSAWVDWYDSGDAPKSEGPELTEVHASAMWRPSSAGGATVSYSHIVWPVLLRDELPPLTQATLADGELDRASLSAWRDLAKDLRLYGRFDRWSNQSDDGLGGEARVSWRDVLLENGEVSAGVFANEGQFTSLDGFRVGFRRWSQRGAWFASYEWVDQELDGADPIEQEVWRAGWDGSLGTNWDLSLHADWRTGDAEDALVLGFVVQRRF